MKNVNKYSTLLTIIIICTFSPPTLADRNNEVSYKLLKISILIGSCKNAASMAIAADKEGFSNLVSCRDKIRHFMNLLKKGSKKANIHPVPETLPKEWKRLEDIWLQFDKKVTTILEAELDIRMLRAYQEAIEDLNQGMFELFEKIAKEMVRLKSDTRQVFLVTRQLVMIRRITNDIKEVIENTHLYKNNSETKDNSITANPVKQFKKDLERLRLTIMGMQSGSPGTGFKKINNNKISAMVKEGVMLNKSIQKIAGKLLAHSPNNLDAHLAYISISSDSRTLFAAIDELLVQYRTVVEARD